MELTEKKKEIMELSLNTRSNGVFIYKLLDSGCLDNALSMLTNENIVKTNAVLSVKEYFNANEQFIDLLSEFIHFFEKNFAALCNKEVYIELILKDKAPEFLLSKKYWGNNNYIDYYKYNMKKIIVENTLKIIRFISDNKEFKKLNIYNLDINNENDVDRLFEFIKNVVWCNYDEYSLLYVFLIENEENITSDIKDFYDNNWKKLMSNYNKKIRYVRKIVS